MGKKNKKQTQKKRSAKALKRRSQKNELRKINKVARQGRKTPGMPGVPGDLPPHMRAKAESLSNFAMPVFEVANPQSPGQMNALAALVQSWWQAFEHQDLDERAQILTQTRTAYDTQTWSDKVSFDELTEVLLKRHIALAPDTHSVEERALFSQEEIENAMKWTMLPDVADKDQSEEAVDTIEVAAQARPDAVIAAEPEPPDPPQAPISHTLPSTSPYDAASVLATLDASSRDQFTSLAEDVMEHHEQADFINPEDEKMEKLMAFQDQLVDLFTGYLGNKGLPSQTVRSVLEGLKPFPNEFLKTYHQASIFTADADQVEEYIMDFYLRKSRRTELSDRYLLDSFRCFYLFLETMGYPTHAGEIRERIEEIFPEYEDDVRA